jgi:hypothetical protein
MKKLLFTVIIFFPFVYLLQPITVQAQTDTQSFSLKTGWNAIFLEVEPANTAPSAVLITIMSNVVSIWKWIPGTRTIQFIQNPTEFPLDQAVPNWLVYFNPAIGANNLNAIHGESVYLIKVNANCTLTITGIPKIPHIDWKADSFNLVGFHLSNPSVPATTPTYYNFFLNSSAHTGQGIYTLNNTTSKWEPLTALTTTNMERGKAFWIYCKGYSDYQGPLSVQLEQSTGLNYGSTLIDQDIRVFNKSSASMDVYMNVSSTAANLHYWQFDTSTNSGQWTVLPTQLTKLKTVAPWQTPPTETTPVNNTEVVRLGTKRFGMSGTNTACVTVSNSSNGQGIRILIPVSVTGVSPDGLWVGTANIKKVSAIGSTITSNTATEYPIRLILHKGPSGTRLLSNVTQLWDKTTTPRKLVLVANDDKINSATYDGVAMRDGQPVGRRISSTAFPYPLIKTMSGTLGTGVVATYTNDPIIINEYDSTNPYLHLFHPKHKYDVVNKPYTYGGIKFARNIIMLFQDIDPNTGTSLAWGSNEISGSYTEIIYLNYPDTTASKAVQIEGTFQLHKVNDITDLVI